MNGSTFRIRFAYFLLSLILLIYGIIAARDFLYPIALSILFSYLLFPVANFLEKKKIPRIIAILISLLMAIILIGGATVFIYKRIESLIQDFPALKQQAIKNIDILQNYIEELFGIKDNTLEILLKKRVSGLFEFGNDLFNNVFTATAGTLFKIAIMPVYVFLFLFYRTKFAHFILMLVSPKKRLMTVKILRDISQIAGKYMGGVLMVVVLLSIINSTGLLIIGIKYAILLGIISSVFTFIPYFGSILGAVMLIVFSLLSMDSPHYALKVGIFYIMVIFIEHNVLTPNIVGGNVRINPFIIILSLVVAASVWGIPGMLVIVPFMAILKTISTYVPGLKPYAFLLGMRGARRHAIHIPTIREIISRKKECVDPNQD